MKLTVKRKDNDVFIAVVLMAISVAFITGIVALCGYLWDYSISQILVWCGKEDTFRFWWHGVVMGIIPGVGQLCFLVAGCVFLISFFM